MKLIFSIILIASCMIATAKSNELITQGKTSVLLEDLDGFAYTMPNKIRSGFFKDHQRVEKTLGTLLNMKHVYNDLFASGKLNASILTKRVDEKVSKLFAYDDSTMYLMDKENTYKTIRHFLDIKESYKIAQEKILDSISKDSLSELASEYFEIHKNEFQIPETRTIQYLSIEFNDSNKDMQFEVIKNCLANIKKSKNEDIYSIENYLKNSDIKYIISDELNNIVLDKKKPRFSEYVFSTSNKGIIDNVLELSNKFLIVKILKITPNRIAKFSEAEPQLLSKLKQEKAKNEFESYLLDLTKDSININEENITSLLTRYD